MRYYGASTPRILETYRQTLASLDKAPFTILMTHAGLQGTMDFEAAMVSRSQLEPFRNLVDYVALGHFHKPFSQDDWIYNPGSLETVTVEECAWPDRGAYLVQVDSERSPEHQAEKVITKRRPFVRLVIQVDTLLNPAEMSHAVTQAARDYMPGEGGQRPVIDIFLRGALQYDRALLDTKALEETVHLSCNPLVARIVDQTALDSSDIALAETLSRPEVEQQVLSELIKRDARVRGAEKEWSTLITHLKNAALLGTAPNEIARELRMFLANHPLENGNADQVGIVS